MCLFFHQRLVAGLRAKEDSLQEVCGTFDASVRGWTAAEDPPSGGPLLAQRASVLLWVQRARERAGAAVAACIPASVCDAAALAQAMGAFTSKVEALLSGAREVCAAGRCRGRFLCGAKCTFWIPGSV